MQKKASSTPVQIRELLNKIRIPTNERIWGAKKGLKHSSPDWGTKREIVTQSPIQENETHVPTNEHISVEKKGLEHFSPVWGTEPQIVT